MFTIQKDLNGIFWHIYNNLKTKVNVSDFDIVVDAVALTFIIQCKNGSNIPSQAISISLIEVVDLSVGTSPIPFSGAAGLIQLLKSLDYTPYLEPPTTPIVIYRVGQVGVFKMTQDQIDANFDGTGLGTNVMLGWAKRNGQNGTLDQRGKFSINQGSAPFATIGASGGNQSYTLVSDNLPSRGVRGVIVGSTNDADVVATNGTVIRNTSDATAFSIMNPHLIDLWVERVTELVVSAGSGGVGAVESVNGQTGIVVIPIPTNTSDLVNDGENGTDPFITAADVVVPNLEQVTDIGATTTNQITVQNVKIGSNAFGNTIVGQIGTLPTGTFMTAIGYGAGNGSTGQGGTYIGASAGSINFFDKNICLSANANASTGSADNQFVINTNTKNIRFDTNVPLNILFQFPTVGGRFPISVNGNTADSAGNIVVSSGAVDSVNGQTGVVVLDAADVGAEPTKGSDDNYVTDAQLVVIGNTSGTNSGDNATNTKYEVAAATGAVISFATPQIYNSIASPSSSNLTDNLTGARIGIVQKIYHNAGTAPTVPAGWVLRGTGAYVTSTLNIIYAEWSAGTTVEYWITQ